MNFFITITIGVAGVIAINLGVALDEPLLNIIGGALVGILAAAATEDC